MFICSEIQEVNNCLDEKRMLIEQKKSVNLKNEVYKNTKNHEILHATVHLRCDLLTGTALIIE